MYTCCTLNAIVGVVRALIRHGCDPTIKDWSSSCTVAEYLMGTTNRDTPAAIKNEIASLLHTDPPTIGYTGNTSFSRLHNTLLYEGGTVLLFGLQFAVGKKLNGKHGIVGKFSPEAGRWMSPSSVQARESLFLPR